MIAAIVAARGGLAVALVEKLPLPGRKLKASGGGRCNLSNTLVPEAFIKSFGRNGKFMIPALKAFDQSCLISFMSEIGVSIHAPDGFHYFPVSHDSTTVLEAMAKEIEKSGVSLLCGKMVKSLKCNDDRSFSVKAGKEELQAKAVIVATGGCGYPSLGGGFEGFEIVSNLGHKIVKPVPAMQPLLCRETWVANCRADTIGKAVLRINLPAYQ